MSRCNITKKVLTNISLRRQKQRKKYRQPRPKKPAYSLNQQPLQIAPVWTPQKRQSAKKLSQNRIRTYSTKHLMLSGKNCRPHNGPKTYSPRTKPNHPKTKNRHLPSHSPPNWIHSSTLTAHLAALSLMLIMHLGATYSRAFRATHHNRTSLRRLTRRQASQQLWNHCGIFLSQQSHRRS